MAREPTQRLDEDTQQRIRAALAEKALTQAELARRAGVHRSVVTRILDHARRQQNVSSRALREIARVLGISPGLIVEQGELELEITNDFITAARDALTDELLRLKQNVGIVRANRITAVVGIEIHGISPEKQVFERVFALPVPRQKTKT